MKAPGSRLRFVSFAWAYVECLVYSGLVFGWGSLVYVLKDEGLYLSLCDHGNYSDNHQHTNNSSPTTQPISDLHLDPNCDAREKMFNLVFTVASSVLGVGSCILGLISLRFGTRVTRIVTTFVFVAGSLCFAIASTDAPWLLFPGLSFMAIAGAGVFATNAQVSFLFPARGSLVVALLSGVFDASAAVQLLVKMGHEHGITRSTSYFILTGVFSLTLINTFCLLPKHFIEEQPVGDGDEAGVMDMKNNDMGAKPEGNNFISKTNGGKQPMEITPRKVALVLISPEFTLHLFWFVLLNLRYISYQASINSVLEDTLDSEQQVSDYTSAFLYVLLCGAVVSLVPGLLYDYMVKVFNKSKSPLTRRLMPSVCPLTLASLLGSLLSAFTLFTGRQTLYVEFVLVLFMRSFLFSTLTTYIRQLFPSGYFTALYGTAHFAGGLVSLTQQGLFVWAANEGKMQVDVFLLVLNVSTLVHPLCQWRRSRRQGR